MLVQRINIKEGRRGCWCGNSILIRDIRKDSLEKVTYELKEVRESACDDLGKAPV